MKLIIQIPCYNEEATLAATFADLPRSIDGIDEIEYLVINDGSTDGTAAVARSLGFNHVVGFPNNRGLARAFMAGIDACLRLGADIIVNTDADNQYFGGDIAKLVQPILDGSAEMVIGERPIDNTEHFSSAKKRFQKFGSWVVRVASHTDTPDAPSGFRAYARDAAMQLNLINEYTYTLETIIQAGYKKIALGFVPIRTNPETRKSRLFKNMWSYMRRSASVIVRSFMMYKPLKFFMTLAVLLLVPGVFFIARFLVHYFGHGGAGNVQSLVLASMMIVLSGQCAVAGLTADMIAANRKILEEVQYRLRRGDCGGGGAAADGEGGGKWTGSEHSG